MIEYFKFNVVGLVGKIMDFDSINVLKNFMHKIGGNLFIGDFFKFDNIDYRDNFLVDNLSNIENNYNVLFLNVNLRLEAPLLNVKIKNINEFLISS